MTWTRRNVAATIAREGLRARVLEMDVVYCGGGDVAALMEIPTAELARMTRGRAVDLALEPAAGMGPSETWQEVGG